MAKTAEEKRARQRAHYEANKAAYIERARLYALAHPEKVKGYKAKWQAENSARVAEGKRAAYAEDAERMRAQGRARYAANAAARIAAVRAYYAENRQRLLMEGKARVKAWAAANPEKRNESAARRRAIKKATAVEQIDYLSILRESRGLCGICGKPLDLFGIDFDHIIPLARGGTHTRENLQASHARCNRSKGFRVA